MYVIIKIYDMKVIETWLYHVSILIKVQEQTNKP